MRSRVKSFAGRNAVAFLALFVALGGTATAASQYIDGKNIKKNTITSKQVKNGSLLAKDFKSGQLPRGRAGTPGAVGSVGAAGSAGAAGPAGSPGTAGLTLKTYSVPDAVRPPAATSVANEWDIPPASEFHAIGAVAGYSFTMACSDLLPFRAGSYDTWHYHTVMRVAMAGNALGDSYAGGGVATSYTVGGSPPQPTYTNNTDGSGEMTDTFSTTTGEVVRVAARVVVDGDSCEYRNVKLYVWS